MPSAKDALVTRFVADLDSLYRVQAHALAREALEAALGSTLKGDTVNNGRRPGRPAKTTSKSAAPTKRGPGRPPGSKNKVKTTVVTAKPAEPPPAPRFTRLPPKLPRHLQAKTKTEPAAVGAMLSDGAGPDSGGGQAVRPIKRVRA